MYIGLCGARVIYNKKIIIILGGLRVCGERNSVRNLFEAAAACFSSLFEIYNILLLSLLARVYARTVEKMEDYERFRSMGFLQD